jgi:vitamin B12 transporter
MRKYYLTMCSLLIAVFSSFGQMTTVELNEVVIEALPFEKYSAGSKIEKSDSLQMKLFDNRTLADYLRQNSTVYIKEQGNGMLASISFRGTGASHTGVFWHGININSLTLGSSDFNGVPMFLFDEVAVQYGGASSLHGSDAIGGSVHLNSSPQWTNGSRIQLRQDIGSFGNLFSGVKLNIGNGNFESKTRIFNRSLANNFTYAITDRVGDRYEIKQENAQVQNFGILQEFNGKVSKSGYLSLKGWYADNHHQIQPLMVTHQQQLQQGDEIYDRNLRLVGEYEHFFDKGFLSSAFGYVWDYQVFNDSDLIETKRTFASINNEWNLGNKTTVKAGGSGQYIVPSVWSYDDDIAEFRGDIFLSLKHELLTDWVINLNGRQTYVPFTQAPFAPSVSTNYTIRKARTDLIFRAQAQRSYRVPTFNDRYWGLEGNKDLRAENGYSMELGHNFTRHFSDGKLTFDAAGYFMKIDDWIAWKPAGNLWRPYNLKQVESSGIEFNGKWVKEWRKFELEFGGMYAYNRAILLKGISESDPAVGYQLPYTPIHRAVAFANLIYKSYRLSVNNNYTGKRRGIDVINESVDDFLLTDIHISKNIHLGKQLLAIEGQVLNVFDLEYQNVKRYAMPGRNYLISLNFYINN